MSHSYEAEGGVMSYDGPTTKSQYKKKGNTVRHCTCNTVGYRTDFIIVDKNGKPIQVSSTPITYSLDKKERWNQVEEAPLYFISPKRNAKTAKAVHNYDPDDQEDDNEEVVTPKSSKSKASDDSETPLSGRQAKKKKRQEQAKMNTTVRKSKHRSPPKSSTDTTGAENQPAVEQEGRDHSDEESEDENQKKEDEQYMMLFGEHLDAGWKRKAICRQCNGSRFVKNKETKPKAFSYDVRVV